MKNNWKAKSYVNVFWIGGIIICHVRHFTQNLLKSILLVEERCEQTEKSVVEVYQDSCGDRA